MQNYFLHFKKIIKKIAEKFSAQPSRKKGGENPMPAKKRRKAAKGPAKKKAAKRRKR